MNETCACGQPSIVRYRILPHKHLATSKVWAPQPRWIAACERASCQKAAVDGGTVMRVESLVEGAVHREVKGE